MKKVLAVLLFFSLTSSIFAKIEEFAHFQDLPKYVKKETLVILDVDDTLLITEQMLGCDEWFISRWSHHKNEVGNADIALDKALAEWEAVRHITRMEIVEAGSEKIVENLQAQGITVMGLTSQGLALATRTRLQLLDQKIDFLKTAPASKDHYFQVANHGVLYRHGILFTSGRNKGVAFLQLIDDLGIKPKEVVFVNDKESHLKEIETALEKRAIPFLGLRYSYSDAKKKAYRPEVAEYQFSHSTFKHIVSDQEAFAKLKLEMAK